MKIAQNQLNLWFKLLFWGFFLMNIVISLPHQSSDWKSVNISFLAKSQQAEASWHPSVNSLKQQDNDHIILINDSALLQRQRPITKPAFFYAPYCAYQWGVNYCLTTVTAYSSSRDQTDSSPFITANGTRVKDGIVACNFLAFGTKVRFPDLFGNKVFVVEDRMAPKNSHKIDVWFPNRSQALRFGIKKLKVEIISD